MSEWVSYWKPHLGDTACNRVNTVSRAILFFSCFVVNSPPLNSNDWKVLFWLEDRSAKSLVGRKSGSEVAFPATPKGDSSQGCHAKEKIRENNNFQGQVKIREIFWMSVKVNGKSRNHMFFHESPMQMQNDRLYTIQVTRTRTGVGWWCLLFYVIHLANSRAVKTVQRSVKSQRTFQFLMTGNPDFMTFVTTLIVYVSVICKMTKNMKRNRCLSKRMSAWPPQDMFAREH